MVVQMDYIITIVAIPICYNALETTQGAGKYKQLLV